MNNNSSNNTWEIMHIVRCFNNRTANLRPLSEERKNIEILYAQALRIQSKNEYGHVMAINDFIEDVADGMFTDYDGSGVFLDWDGNRQIAIRCNKQWLNKNKSDFPFVLWFNK